MAPTPNGSRKSGLWQKASEIVNFFGPNPSLDLLASSDTPSGLTNLGATCYANSILQCLCMNKSFREGVFSVEPEVLSREPVLNNLIRLFAQLHSSEMAFMDSAPFTQTLEIDNGVQQDIHEFLTLVFSLLERCLSHSKVPKARTTVQDLFRGSVSHVTRQTFQVSCIASQPLQFDDEHVSNLGRQPFGSPMSTSAANAGKNGSVDCSPSAKAVDVHVNGNRVDASQMQSSNSNGADNEKTFSSSDAYMLMYVLRHSKIDAEKTTAHSKRVT